jgi:hypothetical protein
MSDTSDCAWSAGTGTDSSSTGTPACNSAYQMRRRAKTLVMLPGCMMPKLLVLSADQLQRCFRVTQPFAETTIIPYMQTTPAEEANAWAAWLRCSASHSQAFPEKGRSAGKGSTKAAGRSHQSKWKVGDHDSTGSENGYFEACLGYSGSEARDWREVGRARTSKPSPKTLRTSEMITNE